MVGCNDGCCDGCDEIDGFCDVLGLDDGILVGLLVGFVDGLADGCCEGCEEIDGFCDGLADNDGS